MQTVRLNKKEIIPSHYENFSEKSRMVAYPFYFIIKLVEVFAFLNTIKKNNVSHKFLYCQQLFTSCVKIETETKHNNADKGQSIYLVIWELSWTYAYNGCTKTPYEYNVWFTFIGILFTKLQKISGWSMFFV